MKSLLKSAAAKIGLTIGVALAASLAFAAVTYFGFDPSTGLEATHGVLTDGSTTVLTIAQTGQTITAQKGGNNTGFWTATGATTGAGTLTFAVKAPTGRFCQFKDVTTPADSLVQTGATDGTTIVTVAGTIVSGDVIGYQCGAF